MFRVLKTKINGFSLNVLHLLIRPTTVVTYTHHVDDIHASLIQIMSDVS